MEGVMPVLTHSFEIAFLVIGEEHADLEEGVVDLGALQVFFPLNDGTDFPRQLIAISGAVD